MAEPSNPTLSASYNGVIDASAVAGAALERLNRRSVFSLLQQITQEVNAQIDTSATVLTDVAELKTKLEATIVKVDTGTANNQTDVAEILNKIAVLSQTLTTHLAGHDEGVTNLVGSVINDRKAEIVGDSLTAMSQTIDEKIHEKMINAVDLTTVKAEITSLKAQLQIIEAASKQLSADELTQVKTLISQVMQTMDVGTAVSQMLVSVNGKSMSFAQLTQLLADRPAVLNVSLEYAFDEISAATFVLSNATTATFSATRVDLTDQDIKYAFKTANLAGLPAEFEIRFQSKPTTVQIGGKSIVSNQFELVHQSNVIYGLSVL